MAQTWCSLSSSPGLPRGLFGTDFEAAEARVARTFLRTFWQFYGNRAAISARGVPVDALGRDFAPIGKQTWIALGNLGGSLADGS